MKETLREMKPKTGNHNSVRLAEITRIDDITNSTFHHQNVNDDNFNFS